MEELLEELLEELDELDELELLEELVVFFLALLEYSFSMVRVPALPSTERPLAAWKSRTACSVAAPKSPSALPVR